MMDNDKESTDWVGYFYSRALGDQGRVVRNYETLITRKGMGAGKTMDGTMRPDYKPGDAEFDDDSGAVKNLGLAIERGEKISHTHLSLYRQATYWQHEAITVPTLLDNSVRRAYAELQAKHDAALETIASMARTIERLAK